MNKLIKIKSKPYYVSSMTKSEIHVSVQVRNVGIQTAYLSHPSSGVDAVTEQLVNVFSK
jgi:hypothetical protein